ncbi:MAG: hypothetical protein AAF730_05170 [Bacteroidota bacterium]
MENIIGILIFLAFLIFEALQLSKKNKKRQQQLPGEYYPDYPYAAEQYPDVQYELPPPKEPESDLERALREIQDALTGAAEPKPQPAPPRPERREEPLALPPRPLPTHAPEAKRLPEVQPEVFAPKREPSQGEDAFERSLPVLRDERRVARPVVTAEPHLAPKESSAVVPQLTHPLLDELDLRDPKQLRRAVLLHEILGPPKSRRR